MKIIQAKADDAGRVLEYEPRWSHTLGSDPITRQQYKIDEKVAAEWKNFCKGMPYPSIALNAALTDFMKRVEEGKIRFVYDPTKN